ncbi:YncE family protein [Prescottella agglutinans]|uniref:YVTN family beta-propeller protein n=1 Tax=Prescottella agglutinans TaxID=1644129 RepID=A0ABT6MKG7_9NOCA|nr:YncE family protein [Prescottella agglutinans]MDH6284816.1 YVTN family beta-propeller protein [Prescottella agglutinans]
MPNTTVIAPSYGRDSRWGSPVRCRRTVPGIIAAVLSVLGLLIGTTPAASAETVTATVPVGADPYGVAISPDGARAYVANLGSGTVSVINTATNSVTATVEVGERPAAVAITPDGTRVYVTNATNGGNGTVSVIDTATNIVTATITVGRNPGGVAIRPDGARAYVTNATNGGNGTVSVIDTATNIVTATITVGRNPGGVAIGPDGARAYVINYSSGTMSVIDTATETVARTINVGELPNAVAITPDGSRVYVTNYFNDVFVVDTTTNTATAAISLSPVLTGLAISPDGARAYVVDDYGRGRITVIDTATNSVAATFYVPEAPRGFAITPDGARAYATSSGGIVSVFAIGGALVAPTLAGTPPDGMLGEPYTHVFASTGYPTPTVRVTAWSLPAGLTLTEDGVLSGTPTASGRFEFSVTASNGVKPDATVPVVLEVKGAPTVAGTPPRGAAGKPYNYTFTKTGYPAPKLKVATGTLPAGVTLSPEGVLSGTPTVGGRFEFTVRGSNGIGADAVLPVVLDLNEVPHVSGTPPNGVVGQSYRHTFTISGYPAPSVTVTGGTLPAGLTLTGDGVLSGIPTASGRFGFTITASNGIGSDSIMPVLLEVTSASTPSTGSLGS